MQCALCKAAIEDVHISKHNYAECVTCDTPHHRDCYDLTSQCSRYGCSGDAVRHVPKKQDLTALVIGEERLPSTQTLDKFVALYVSLEKQSVKDTILREKAFSACGNLSSYQREVHFAYLDDYVLLTTSCMRKRLRLEETKELNREDVMKGGIFGFLVGFGLPTLIGMATIPYHPVYAPFLFGCGGIGTYLGARLAQWREKHDHPRRLQEYPVKVKQLDDESTEKYRLLKEKYIALLQ